MRTEEQELLAPSGPGFLDRVIALSLRNKALVIIGLVLLVAFGLRSARDLPIDAVPDVTNVQVQVLTDSPGLSPLEVERFVTWPVETAMSGLPRTEEVRSLSRFGLSVVTVVFEEGTDLWWARQAVAERLAQAREAIPEGYGGPEIGPPSTGARSSSSRRRRVATRPERSRSPSARAPRRWSAPAWRPGSGSSRRAPSP